MIDKIKLVVNAYIKHSNLEYQSKHKLCIQGVTLSSKRKIMSPLSDISYDRENYFMVGTITVPWHKKGKNISVSPELMSVTGNFTTNHNQQVLHYLCLLGMLANIFSTLVYNILG
ncbi:unnamed protein product [Trifolium pratense]|uniref:Uncharacterized protein n=1 Tax=Trifolium pratense TaxID=57577 RepID=A0ACB0KFY5_TRIPR|nr:unnamed protein product [Trifolium pratense]